MSEQQLQNYIQFTKEKVETFFHEYVTNLQAPSLLKESMLYSLMAGGKRLRPMLVFATLKALGHDEEKGIAVASAVEMIHTYSLIHDDLPSMDDDDLRRGKPTNHKVYGEATAILAGDALLTNSFQVIINALQIRDEVKVELLSELTKAAGAEGMIKGQVADMQGEQQHEYLTLQELEDIHIHKTGKLLSFCVKAGAILGEATEEQLKLLEKFSFNLGIAFQIQDDILDIEGSEEAIGKPVGSDTENEKTTYPLLLGMEEAKQKLHNHIQSSLDALKTANLDTGLLEEICLYVAKRDR